MKIVSDMHLTTSFVSQLASLLYIWVRSYRRNPVRLALIVASICASCLTLVIGWNLATAIDRLTPKVPAEQYLIMNAAAASEAQSFIPVESLNFLRSAASGSAQLRGLAWQTTLVLAADIVLDTAVRHPSLLRAIEANPNGQLPGVQIVNGRAPRVGQRELAVSPALALWLRAHGQSDRVLLARKTWTVVGTASRPGAESQVEMYSDLVSVQQEMDVTESISSIQLDLNSDRLVALLQLFDQIKNYRLQAVPLKVYQGQFVNQLHSQLAIFWTAFLGVCIVCTVFGIYTIALTLFSEREHIRQIVLRLGYSPRVIANADMAEGAAIGLVAGLLALGIFAVLFQGERMQSALPSGAVSLRLQMSIGAAIGSALLGSALGALIFSWHQKTAWLTNFRYRIKR
jgi:hypothetical protein